MRVGHDSFYDDEKYQHFLAHSSNEFEIDELIESCIYWEKEEGTSS